jgi:glycerophosphoryl diester phosphodiesterase
MIRFFLPALLFSMSAFALDWQGHRGARGLYPENTIGAMEESLKYPVTTLELDVVVSKDMQVVVSHEPWMSEEICTNPEGKTVKDREYNLYKLTYEEITKFDCGKKVHPRFPHQIKVATGKPTLDQLITSTEATLKKLNRSEIPYNIEIKSTVEDERDGFQPDVKTFSDLVIKTIKAKLPLKKFTIQSFDWRVLQYIHKTYPDVKLVALIETKVDPEADLKNLGFNPYVYSPDFTLLTKEHVDFFHKQKIKVIPWTLNEVTDMEKMISFNVDGIITDYPNKIKEILAKKCKAGTNYFNNKCVKIPAHAVPSEDVPGWDCESGYVQKRMNCVKIAVPENGKLKEDGKSWECLEGFVAYRDSCKKL